MNNKTWKNPTKEQILTILDQGAITVEDLAERLVLLHELTDSVESLLCHHLLSDKAVTSDTLQDRIKAVKIVVEKVRTT